MQSYMLGEERLGEKVYLIKTFSCKEGFRCFEEVVKYGQEVIRWCKTVSKRLGRKVANGVRKVSDDLRKMTDVAIKVSNSITNVSGRCKMVSNGVRWCE